MFTFVVMLASAVFVPYVAAPAAVNGAKAVISHQTSTTTQDNSTLRRTDDTRSSLLLTATPFQYTTASANAD
jgi:hypothetical protein